MANDITEDDIEVSLLNILKEDDLGYNIVCCDPGKENKENLMMVQVVRLKGSVYCQR